MSAKKIFHDKLALLLLSILAFLTLFITLSVVLRLGTGQGISDYYIEYRQGPNRSVRGDFSPTGTVWSILTFVWFSFIVLIISVVMSIKTYKIKREVTLVILALGILLLLLAAIVSNVLLGHR